ncbi:MAG: hypothetical protein M1826_007393 [Phylliscum demangeonii]|nr:MAG: hypothetical protein M1826_007393 [Phylliscum demangeonii]
MKTPTRRRGPYRRNAEASVCRICQRAPSPRSNPIVICDGCNGLYHQYCHDPPIEDEVIRVEENEWLCADCMGVRADANMAADGVASSGISEADLQRAMSGEELTVEEKRAYFVRLPQASLVSLLLHATSVHPNLPVFAADVKQIISQPLPAPRPRGLSVVQGLQTDGLPRATAVGGQGMPSSNAQQQPFSQGPGVASAPPAPYQPFKYPKPGNGIRLPPVEYVEDEDEVAFSHLVRDPQTRRLEKASQLQPALLPPPPPPQQPPKAQAERHGSLGGDSMGMDGAMDMARRMSTSTQQPQPLPRPQQPERENGVGLLASAGIATIGTGTASAATGIASADPSRPGTSTGRGEMVDVSGGAGAGSKAMSGVVGA